MSKVEQVAITLTHSALRPGDLLTSRGSGQVTRVVSVAGQEARATVFTGNRHERRAAVKVGGI